MGNSKSKFQPIETCNNETIKKKYDMNIDYYNKMDIEEKNKYITKSHICKRFDITYEELSNIPYLIVDRNSANDMYLYKIEDIENYLLQNPRDFNKKDYVKKSKALAFYQLEPSDLEILEYQQRGNIKYYKIDELKQICEFKYSGKDIDEIITQGKSNYEKAVAERKENRKEQRRIEYEHWMKRISEERKIKKLKELIESSNRHTNYQTPVSECLIPFMFL